MRLQNSGCIADAGFDGSSNFFYLALTRGEIPPRVPAVLSLVLAVAGASTSRSEDVGTAYAGKHREIHLN